MATIGLDKLFYSKITEGENGDETYAAPVALAKAMTAELSVELAEATLYADDGAAEVVKEFQSGTLTLGVDDIGKSVAEDLTGAVIDENGVLISASEDGGAPVAIGFRAKKANGKYRYFWLYRVIFGIPATNLTTKGESIEFSTPSIAVSYTHLWEQSIQRTLLSPEEKKRYFAKFNVEGLLRGDYASRMSGYATARQNGWMSANDIRELENMDRIPAEEGGDLYLSLIHICPLRWMPLTAMRWLTA